MSGYAVFVGILVLGAALRIWGESVRRKTLDQRERTGSAINQAAGFETKPVMVIGNWWQRGKAERIAKAHGWDSAAPPRMTLFRQSIRFVPINEQAAKPHVLLAALNDSVQIENIELPGSKEN